MCDTKSGVIECRGTPTSEAKLFDLRWAAMTTAVTALSLPVAPSASQPDGPMNPEKIADLDKKIVPYVPDEYNSDVLYCAPSPSTLAQANRVKTARKEAQAKKCGLVANEGKEGTA